MNNKKSLFRRLAALCIAVLLLTTLVAGCGKDAKKDDSSKNTATTAKPVNLKDCTVTIATAGGVKLEGIGIGVYADKEKEDIIDFARTNADGVATLKATIPSGSYIILSDVPAGYAAEDYYVMAKKNMVITLSAEMSTEMTPFTLGDVMFDFTVTDQNGTEHTLSKLLESKKAVAINLWYTTCTPCKMEFPFLQQAYNEYKDDVALVAISPMDDASAITAFADENGLTIPMASCDAKWNDWMVANAYGYPTTIIVDRFGTVSFIHSGSIDNSKTFKNMFAFFTAEDYVQTTVSDVAQFANNSDEDPMGSATNPYEHSGSTSFSVEVEPAQTVYYTLYNVDGLKLSVDGSTLKLVCNEKEHTPSKNNISFIINSADATAPVLMNFTNTGSEKATYKVTFTSPEGSAANPITMKDGSTTIMLEADNNRGVYYQYKTPYEGTFTLECKNTVNYTVSIKNLNGTETATLDKNTKKATIDVRKGDKIQVVVIAVAKDGKYPATEAKLNASCKKEEIPATPSTGDGNTSSTLNTNGKLINPDEPIEFGGVLNFDAEVKAGEIVLYHVYRVSGTTLRIADASAYVIYLEKTYTPDKNGYIYIPVTSKSPNTPIVLQIGNGGKANKTYAVKFSFPEGSIMNPYDAEAGTIKTSITEGNEQGVYYQCTVSKDGKMTITLKNITSGVACDIRVDVTNSSFITQQYLLSQSEDGKTLTVDVEAGNEIVINIVALPDEDYKYPAANIETVLSFS